MLIEIFYWVLNMSITASIIGVLIYFLRYIKTMPKFAVCSLWGIVFIRLILPIGIANKYSLMNLFSNFAIKTITIFNGEKLPNLTMTNSIRAVSGYFPITFKSNILENVFNIASIVWIIIAVSAIFAIVIMYLLTKSEINNAVLIKDNIYKSEMVLTPTVYGILKPKIILPITINEESIKYVLAHEQVHIKRLDNLWRMIAIITACIYWFCPFIWFFMKTFFSDMELACDIKAIKNMNRQEQKNYAATLLSVGENKVVLLSSAFGGSKIKVRVQNVLSYKKVTVVSAICFVLLFIAAAIVLLTNSVGG